MARGVDTSGAKSRRIPFGARFTSREVNGSAATLISWQERNDLGLPGEERAYFEHEGRYYDFPDANLARGEFERYTAGSHVPCAGCQ